MQTRQNSHVKYTIKIREIFTITFEQFVEIFINYCDDLFNNKNFLFESQCKQNFDFEKNVYVHVVDVNLSIILIRNTINQSIILTRRVKLNIITKYNQTNYYLIISNNINKIIID